MKTILFAVFMIVVAALQAAQAPAPVPQEQAMARPVFEVAPANPSAFADLRVNGEDGKGPGNVKKISLQDPKSYTLSWISNAGVCEASGDWSGPRPGSGTEMVSLTHGSYKFTLTCGDQSDTILVGAYPISVSGPASPHEQGLTQCVVNATEGPVYLLYSPAPVQQEMSEQASGAVWNPQGIYQMGTEIAWVVKTEGDWSLIWIWGQARGWVPNNQVMSAPCP